MEAKTKLLEAKIHNLRFWVSECNPEVLAALFQSHLEQAGFIIVRFSDHHFPVQGYTAFWLLAESHLAIHTFPNKECAYVELSSCNQIKSEAFKQLVEKSILEVSWNGEGIEVCKPNL